MTNREALVKGGDSGPAFVPGDSSKSLLVRLVSGGDPERVMPPKGGRLAAAQIETLRRWIDAGAPWDAFRPYALALKEVVLPGAGGHPIDRIVEAYARRQKAAMQSPIDDAQFARRVAFDLIGMPLTSAQLDEFIAGTRSDKREQLVRGLLDDQENFVGHWMSFWSDHLRIGSDVASAIFDGDDTARPRQWLEAQLRKNVPVDRLVHDLVTSDICDAYGRSFAPPGEIAAHVESPEMQLSATLAHVFLGVQLKCASCHDSFVDRWKMADTWGLASALGDRPLRMFRCEISTGRVATPKFPLAGLGEITAGADRKQRRREVATLMTKPGNGLFARTIVNRIWARLFGRGLVEPLDEMMEHEPWSPELLDWLAGQFVRDQFDIKKLLHLITTSQAYQRSGVVRRTASENEPYQFTGPEIRHLTAEQFLDAINQLERANANARPSPRAWRTNNNRLMTMLGRPSRDIVATSRVADATPLLALELMNGTLLETAIGRAAQAQEGTRPTPEEVEARVFKVLLGRSPTPRERVWKPAKLDSAALSNLIWTVVMLPEFQLQR